MLNQSEHEKDKALLRQKVEFYENQLQEQSQKERFSSNEFRSQKQAHNE